MSNAILLPGVTRYSLHGAVERYADVARACGFASSTETSDAAACAALVDGVTSLCDSLSVPKLSDLGIGEAAFTAHAPTMAEQALASGSPANNPIVPTTAQLVGLYKEVYA